MFLGAILNHESCFYVFGEVADQIKYVNMYVDLGEMWRTVKYL